ncbi:MAG: S8 family serine peptidase, partial [Armatimonadota bacterium]
MRRHGRPDTKQKIALITVSVILGMMIAAGPAIAATISDDLAGPLRAIAAAEAGDVTTADVTRVVPVDDGRVEVVVVFQNEGAAASTNLSSYNAEVVAHLDRRVQVWVPTSQLNAIASLPQVAQVRLPYRPTPLQGYGATAAESVQLTSASAFHANGITGQGVAVAVIDVGFTDYDEAQIPGVGEGSGRVIDLTGTGMGGSQHGTAVAEVLADFAYGADIYLIKVNSKVTAEQALNVITAQDIDVAVMSLGLFGGPYDGTDTLSQRVNDIRRQGVFWVNAAGNHAQRHWEGTWQDRDNDGFCEWGTGDEDLGFQLTAGVFEAYLSWFQSAGSTTNHDFDLVLYNGMTNEVVARSAVTQNGDDSPREYLRAYVPDDGNYYLRIQRMSPPEISVRNEQFQFFSPNVDIEQMHRVAERSLPIPAEASGAFSVGATRGPVRDIEPTIPQDQIEPFSSRGPAVSGIMKPDMVAPDGVSTSFEQPNPYNPFLGTSAAAPAVGGAAALLLSEQSGRDPATLAMILERHALDLGDEGPDNIYGAGRLRLRVGTDSTAPEVSISFPVNGSTITQVTFTITASITDTGSGISNITLEIDGQNIPDVMDYYDAGRGVLRYPLNTELQRASHTIALQASDFSGNVSDRVTSNFRITAPTIEAGIHMIGLPYADLVNPDPSHIFGTPAGDLQLVRWVPDDTRDIKYHVYPDEFASFNPPDAQGRNPIVPTPPAGLGYFLRLPSRSTLNIGAIGDITQADTYEIQLRHGTTAPRGWNMIGNPFDAAVDWGLVTFVADGQRYDLKEAISEDVAITEGTLFGFVSTPTGGYYDFTADPLEARMEFMGGYWVHVLRDCTLEVYN